MPDPTPLVFPASAAMIARHLGRNLQCVQKIIGKRGIQAVRRFGIVRAFDEAAFEAITKEVQRIDAYHQARHHHVRSEPQEIALAAAH